MTPIRCPRCHRDAPELSAFCAGCGAPLLLGEDEPHGALDAPLDLDRRGGLRGDDAARAAPPPVAIPGPAATPAPFPALPAVAAPGSPLRAARGAPAEPSRWDLGPLPAAVRAEPRLERPPAPKPASGNAVAPRPPAPARSGVARPGPVPAVAPVAARSALPSDPPDPDPDALPEPEVDALEVHLTRAATWRRVIAWVVDGPPFVAAGCALGWSFLREASAGRTLAPAGIDELVDLVARERGIALSIGAAVGLALATYATLAHTLAGATLGKRLAGIRVVGPDGAPPSFARSAIRSALCVPSVALFGVGFLLALFTRTGRALHDLLARTWVVKAP